MSSPSKVAEDNSASKSRKGKSVRRMRKAKSRYAVEKEILGVSCGERAFAQVILQQHQFPQSNPLFDKDLLRKSHTLELGTGTELLSITLSALVKSHTATDIAPLLPLIRKNVALNFTGCTIPDFRRDPGSNICVEELDWETLLSLPLAMRSHYYPKPTEPNAEWDLVLWRKYERDSDIPHGMTDAKLSTLHAQVGDASSGMVVEGVI
ncbi:hypothetical protein AZE42_11776 [Rhizopogon vesiculosus]|uniref:Uncharacterized protein n=1 Tax=Rhizopogon vesiculosus TaxID=180088 RepID=A0A1J8QVY1_9AGAM|nr:hypothetical protein AZE42_11776 [Rhizopogon vesiculosus]